MMIMSMNLMLMKLELLALSDWCNFNEQTTLYNWCRFWQIRW